MRVVAAVLHDLTSQPMIVDGRRAARLLVYTTFFVVANVADGQETVVSAALFE